MSDKIPKSGKMIRVRYLSGPKKGREFDTTVFSSRKEKDQITVDFYESTADLSLVYYILENKWMYGAHRVSVTAHEPESSTK